MGLWERSQGKKVIAPRNNKEKIFIRPHLLEIFVRKKKKKLILVFEHKIKQFKAAEN